MHLAVGTPASKQQHLKLSNNLYLCSALKNCKEFSLANY